MKSSKVEKINVVFTDYTVVPISAKSGEGVKELYETIFKEFY